MEDSRRYHKSPTGRRGMRRRGWPLLLVSTLLALWLPSQNAWSQTTIESVEDQTIIIIINIIYEQTLPGDPGAQTPSDFITSTMVTDLTYSITTNSQDGAVTASIPQDQVTFTPPGGSPTTGSPLPAGLTVSVRVRDLLGQLTGEFNTGGGIVATTKTAINPAGTVLIQGLKNAKGENLTLDYYLDVQHTVPPGTYQFNVRYTFTDS